MVKFYDRIPDSHIAWIEKQHLFYVATAPLSGDGHVNLSPKGVNGTLHVESNSRIWYEDLSGSGVETISHLRENGRVTLMFCALEGAARILRIWGRGTVHELGTPGYAALVPPERRRAGSRAAIVVDVHKVGTSCGYAVPLYAFRGERSALDVWAEKLERRDRERAAGADTVTVDTEAGPRVYAKDGLMAWWAAMNQRSLDGLPGLRHAHLSDAVLESAPRVNGEQKPSASKRQAGSEVVEVAVAGVLPRSKAEGVRLVLVFVLGLALASVYGRAVR
ncbi:hypothetical protein BD413DRAFT_476875 [Trametes elegans]|nr:hypothetical protein BD413DRAFT_476875 [Trametes elegans]